MKRTTSKILAACLLGISGIAAAAQEPQIPFHLWKEAGLPYIQNFSPQEYKESPQNWCIAQDERGVMYFGNYGVLAYDGVSWRHIKIKDTAVHSLCIPPGQNKIYAGAQSDLGYLAPDAAGQLHFVSLLDSIPKAYRNFKDVWRTFAIGNAVYFQTFEYIFRWAGGEVSVWTPQHSFHLAFVVNDNFYVRQRQVGLMQMVGDSLQLAPGGEKFAQEPILMMLPYGAATILVGTLNRGLFLYDGDSFTPFATKADDFLRENQLYHGVVLPNGLFAMATLRGGVAIIDKAGNLCQVLNKASGLRDESVHFTLPSSSGNSGQFNVRLERFGKEHGLPNTRISPASVGERICFATQKGLRRFEATQRIFLPDAIFGETFADTSCWIFRIREDKNKNVWVIAGIGHETINGKAAPQADGQYSWQAIPFSRLNDIGDTFIIYPEKNGVVWFGGSEGIARYAPDIPKNYASDYPVIIRRVATIATDSSVYNSAPFSPGFRPTLKYRDNSLRFEFAALSYDEVAANRYQFMLAGFDEGWSNWTAETKKDYTGLPGGNYVFKVRAKNIYDHIGSETRFAFTILPPWYRSWWAYVSYLLLFVTSGFVVDRTQRSRLIKRELEKAKLREAEITHQKNIALREKNEQLERVLHELKAAQAQLARSESRFRSVAQSANDAIVTANSTGRITFWNKRAEAIFGYSEQEAMGQPLIILMPERYREMHRQGMDRFLITGQPRIIGQVVEIHAVRKDGTEFPIELTVASWQVDDGKFVTGIIRDITKRKQAQAELEKAQALLEAENQRKTEELEKARQLQLSMLPKEIPQLPQVEIEAYMKTATEVGGDYYDFQVEKDGGLTVVIGDATGHGINAGMMVTATKSLLTNLAHEPDLEKIFNQLNGALKRVNLHRHYMALQMIKMKDHRLEVCAAGMPPLLIYRAAKNRVEEVTLKAMPLGSVAEYPYQKKGIALSPGDTIMLMSDGFPELFNHEGEIFDYDRVKATFAEVACQSPGKIIEHFVSVGEAWANGRGQQDDMTFIVLKVK